MTISVFAMLLLFYFVKCSGSEQGEPYAEDPITALLESVLSPLQPSRGMKILLIFH